MGFIHCYTILSALPIGYIYEKCFTDRRSLHKNITFDRRVYTNLYLYSIHFPTKLDAEYFPNGVAIAKRSITLSGKKKSG